MVGAPLSVNTADTFPLPRSVSPAAGRSLRPIRKLDFGATLPTSLVDMNRMPATTYCRYGEETKSADQTS
jgi:hypothetical protein